MQLMPGTAKAVARAYKVQFQAGQLTNAAYNMQLGEAHLGDLIDSYSGSYFLALAAYNAGGGRVQEWMKAFGDPRDPDVDPIDWIERIPFTETREYVVKIMETVQLYRSRLAGPKQALQLVQDLNRGRKWCLRSRRGRSKCKPSPNRLSRPNKESRQPNPWACPVCEFAQHWLLTASRPGPPRCSDRSQGLFPPHARASQHRRVARPLLRVVRRS